MTRKKMIIGGVGLALVLIAIVIAAVSCHKEDGPYGKAEIREAELGETGQLLRDAQLSNVDLFETWAYEYYESQENGIPAYSDADSLLTAMLLADDQIRCENRTEYEGDRLTEDIGQLEKEERLIFIRDNLEVFTALFGEMKIPGQGMKEALPENWKRHDMAFLNEAASLVSVVFADKGGKEAFVGHAGILIDCEGLPSEEGADREEGRRFLFVEKPGFGQPFCASWLKEDKDLIPLLSGRDMDPGETDDQAPLVYINDRLLGKLDKEK